MANLHGNYFPGLVAVTTAETVIGSLGPYAINQGVLNGGAGDLRNLQPATAPGATGVLLGCFLTATLGTGASAVTLRVRQGSITGAIIPNAISFAAAAGGFIASPEWFDPTPSYFTGITYVLTAAVTGASANSTFNAIFTSEDCNSFE